jgi:hypothetical protein
LSHTLFFINCSALKSTQNPANLNESSLSLPEKNYISSATTNSCIKRPSTNSNNVELNSCDETSIKFKKINNVSSEKFQLFDINSNLCLSSNSNDLNSALVLAPCSEVDEQLFKSDMYTNNRFRIMNLSSMLCFATNQTSKKLEQWTCGDYANQYFSLLVDLPLQNSKLPTSSSTCDFSNQLAKKGSGRNVNVSSVDQIIAAVNAAMPGDTIFIAPGNYIFPKGSDTEWVLNGSVNNPIFITAQNPNNKPILDFTHAREDWVNKYYCNWRIRNSSFVVIDNLHITNLFNSGVCVGVDANNYQSGPVWIQNNYFKDIQHNAVLITADNVSVINNEVYRANLENEAYANALVPLTDSWGSAIATWFITPQRFPKNIKYLGNYVHDSYGEGLNFLFADGGEAIGNVVENVWSVYIYGDHADNLKIENNVLRVTKQAFDKAYNDSRNLFQPNAAISLGNEPYDEIAYKRRVNLVVKNNIIAGTWHGLNHYIGQNHPQQSNVPGNTWSNVAITDNVFWDLRGGANTIFWAQNQSNALPPSNGVFSNNKYGPDNYGLYLGNPEVWSSSNNLLITNPPDFSKACK